MKKRKLKKTILAALLAVPVVLSSYGGIVKAQDEDVLQEEENAEMEEENEVGFFLSEQEEEEDDSKAEFFSEGEDDVNSFGDFYGELEATEQWNTDDLISTYIAPDGFVQEGAPVKDGNGGFTVVANGQAVFSNKYTRLGWNADSQVYPWNNAGNNVVEGRRKGAGVEGPYYVALNNDAKGKYGFRITNVGYNKLENTKLDLLLTCSDYENYTYDYTGTKIPDIYPMFGVSATKELWLLFKDELSAQEIKVDVVKSGTNIPANGNYRFRWLDIDIYQRFGIRLQNGSIGHRYATKDSVVNVVQKSLFYKNYEVLTAPAPAVEGEVPQNTVVYELDNSSGFFLAILRPGCGNKSIETACRINNVFKAIQKGSCKTSAGLNWDAKGYGPVEYPVLTKKVGNTLSAQGRYNRIPDSTSEFYYTIQTEIPEEHQAYYYNTCRVSDPLPVGVDYAGYASVKMLPSETDVSSWFNIWQDGRVLHFQATEAALGSPEFYGKAYEFQIKVQMNPTQLTPSYSEDSYQYEVKNQASITCARAGNPEQTNWSNEVTTECIRNKNKVHFSSVRKYTANFQSENWKEDILLPSADAVYQYKLSINVPDNEYGGYMNRMEIVDILPTGVEKTADAVAVYENGQNRADSRFVVSVNGKNITVKATAGALENRSFYGKQYDVVFNVKMCPDQLSCSYNGNVASYAVSSDFSVTTQHKGDSQAVTLTSNRVVDRASINRAEPASPSKWILKDGQRVDTAEYYGRDFDCEFELLQAIPSNKKEWMITSFNFQDSLANCFKIKSIKIYVGQEEIAAFGASSGVQGDWKLTLSGNIISISTSSVLPDYCYGNEVRVRIKAGMKKGANLRRYYVESPDSDAQEAHIYNIATSTFGWLGGEPSVTSRNTEKTKLIVKEAVPKGRITVQKTDETGKALSGGTFEITAANNIYSASGNLLVNAAESVDVVSTDKNGMAVSKELYLGEYNVKEIIPPPGYAINPLVKQIKISSTKPEETVSFENRKNCVRIKKISETEQAGKIGPGIADAGFILWEDGTRDKETLYVTDKEGLIEIKGLEPNTYCLQEKYAPSGYVKDDTIRKFTVGENGLVNNENGYTIEIENRYVKAEFLKTDKVTGKAVSGATLQLKTRTGDVIDTWISDVSPHRINRLAPGEYVLEELLTPAGYKKGEAVNCVVNDVAEVQSFKLSNVKLVTITLGKILHGDEIIWGQGNPCFTFTVQGMDMDGEEHVYYDTIEFARENTDTRADVCKTVILTVPAGNYKVKESKVMRYKLEKIDQVVNGVVEGASVEFDLSGNQNGKAVFINKKTGDGLLTDTDFIRNIIIPEK